MRDKTAALLSDPHPNSHIVFPYNDEVNFTEAVGLFASAGIEQGESVVLGTTKEHRKRIEQRLKDEGFVVAELQREGRLTTFDASGLLCDFFQGDIPDTDTFGRLIGGIIETPRSNSPSGKVRLYGEMVNLLCGHKNVDATARLEDLWSEAIAARVPRLCSYSLSMLPSHSAGSLPERIVKAHSHTLAA